MAAAIQYFDLQLKFIAQRIGMQTSAMSHQIWAQKIVILWKGISLKRCWYAKSNSRTGCCIIWQTPLMHWLKAIIAVGSRGEATDQYILAPDLLPIHPRLLGPGKFKPCFSPSYFLLQLSDCMMEACMLLAVVRVHEHWWLQLNPLGEWG